MRVSVKAEIAQRKAEGNFFRKDPAKTMLRNALDLVEWLSEQGARELRSQLANRSYTGFTRDNIEGFTYKRDQILTNAYVQSRFGKTRLKPGLSRPGGRRGASHRREWAYDANRVPYIVMRVLETGHYGGRRIAQTTLAGHGKLRWRSSGWAAGVHAGPNFAGHLAARRTAALAVQRTYRKMRAYERAAGIDLTKGLN